MNRLQRKRDVIETEEQGAFTFTPRIIGTNYSKINTGKSIDFDHYSKMYFNRIKNAKIKQKETMNKKYPDFVEKYNQRTKIKNNSYCAYTEE